MSVKLSGRVFFEAVWFDPATSRQQGRVRRAIEIGFTPGTHAAELIRGAKEDCRQQTQERSVANAAGGVSSPAPAATLPGPDESIGVFIMNPKHDQTHNDPTMQQRYVPIPRDMPLAKHPIVAMLTAQGQPLDFYLKAVVPEAIQLGPSAAQAANNAQSVTTKYIADPIETRRRLERIFRRYNPEKLGTIDQIMETFRGKEDIMFEKLRAGYGPEPGPEEESHYDPGEVRRRVERIFMKHNPSKLATIDKALAAFQGKEDELFKALEEKYGPEPDKDEVIPKPADAAAKATEKNNAAVVPVATPANADQHFTARLAFRYMPANDNSFAGRVSVTSMTSVPTSPLLKEEELETDFTGKTTASDVLESVFSYIKDSLQGSPEADPAHLYVHVVTKDAPAGSTGGPSNLLALSGDTVLITIPSIQERVGTTAPPTLVVKPRSTSFRRTGSSGSLKSPMARKKPADPTAVASALTTAVDNAIKVARTQLRGGEHWSKRINNEYSMPPPHIAQYAEAIDDEMNALKAEVTAKKERNAAIRKEVEVLAATKLRLEGEEATVAAASSSPSATQAADVLEAARLRRERDELREEAKQLMELNKTAAAEALPITQTEQQLLQSTPEITQMPQPLRAPHQQAEEPVVEKQPVEAHTVQKLWGNSTLNMQQDSETSSAAPPMAVKDASVPRRDAPIVSAASGLTTSDDFEPAAPRDVPEYVRNEHVSPYRVGSPGGAPGEVEDEDDVVAAAIRRTAADHPEYSPIRTVAIPEHVLYGTGRPEDSAANTTAPDISHPYNVIQSASMNVKAAPPPPPPRADAAPTNAASSDALASLDPALAAEVRRALHQESLPAEQPTPTQSPSSTIPPKPEAAAVRVPLQSGTSIRLKLLASDLTAFFDAGGPGAADYGMQLRLVEKIRELRQEIGSNATTASSAETMNMIGSGMGAVRWS